MIWCLVIKWLSEEKCCHSGSWELIAMSRTCIMGTFQCIIVGVFDSWITQTIQEVAHIFTILIWVMFLSHLETDTTLWFYNGQGLSLLLPTIRYWYKPDTLVSGSPPVQAVKCNSIIWCLNCKIELKGRVWGKKWSWPCKRKTTRETTKPCQWAREQQRMGFWKEREAIKKDNAENF